MKSFKVYVEIGSHSGGGTNGAWQCMSSDCFETVIQAQHFNEAERIARAQYGGPANCKVYVRGEV